jgi:excinuclease UvrABC ATPase subunit
MLPVPSHFSRVDPRGWCPACKGQREVTAVSERLVLENWEATPEGETFLTPEANAVMKGVRRNELNPFLRRLSAEGLWDLSSRFVQLSGERRNLILYGFWSRPGGGSFLKSASANPAEVGSWLRWDGLYQRVLHEADRSTNVDWIRRLKESKQQVRCPQCNGSGLQQFAHVLRVGKIPFSDWSVNDDPAHRLNLLRSVSVHTPRQRETLMRILDCLAPLAKSGTSAARAAVVERAVGAFTTMEAVNPNDGARN